MGTTHRLFLLYALLSLCLIPAISSAATPEIADVALVRHALSDNGDDDGYADTNETVQLVVTVRNLLETELSEVTVLLATDDPKIECLIQHAAYAGVLGAGETLTLPPFVFKVGDVNRGDPHEHFSALFRVSMTSAVSGAVPLWPEQLVLDLDLDVAGGSGQGDYFEGFESGSFGSLTTMNLDAGLYGLEASDGYRCQFTDPDWVNSNSYDNTTDCWLGANELHGDKYYWHVSDGDAGATVPGRSYSGRYSVHMGEYLSYEDDWTTPMAYLEGLGSHQPINLGAGRVCETTRTTPCTGDPDCPSGESCVAVAPELSFKHQADFPDDRLVADFGRSADGGAVAVQLADEAGNPVGDWVKIYPYANLYDRPRDDNWVNCQFDPIDDGNTEDDFFDPSDPFHEYGPSTLCFPEPLFAYLGDTDAPFDPAEIGNASDGPGLAGATGPGTWVESRFDLRPFRGRRIRIRFISSSLAAGYPELIEDLFEWNPIAGDDGWWIDDIAITDTLAAPAVLAVDSKDNSGLPGVTDGDADGYCDSDCDDADAACSVDCSDADSDGVRICNGDCDEADAAVYPGAGEVCDGVSNNCDQPLWPALEIWTPTTIDGPSAAAVSVFAADIDSDGDLDVVTASYDTDTIAWHENTAGDGSAWTAHTISTTADGATGVHAADINGDGHMDVLAASELNTTVAWYDNTAGDGSAWTERAVTTSIEHAGGLMAADVDGDLDLDVLAAGAENDRVRWYENVNGDGTAWSPTTIVPATSRAFAVFGANMDGDGDLDVVVSGLIEGVWETRLFLNRRGDGSQWVGEELDRFVASTTLCVADIDGDDDPDILAGHSGRSRLWWNEQVSGADWDRHYLDYGIPVGSVGSVVAADLDGDDDLDALAAGSWFGEVVWFENVMGDGSSWAHHSIALDAVGATSACAGDVDDDGDLDVLSAGAEEVTWYYRGNLELDDDGDGVADCEGDCDDADLTVWGIPGEVLDLTLLEDRQTLTWSPPADPGGTTPLYDTLRVELPDGFAGAACVESGDGSDTQAVDTDPIDPGGIYYYLVVATSGCGRGSAGCDSDDHDREICACP